MNPRYPDVALRALHRCEYCHAPEAVFNMAFEVEHVVPLALGGRSADANLALACRSCNVHKGSRVSSIDDVTAVLVALFNPRSDDWREHFQVDVDIGTIVGMTSTGRATVSCLRMNGEAQLDARRQWRRLGVFP